ncbi:pupal cuticle protein 27 [Ischnura elegans]|uniref:pupal cuticle protein 27 n=1 Tax=Ischnura elegans TaxID=197161 RepID=UPI001ED8A4C9|nr:pupal cuticle protein 27 [Ischnura elegans]
MLLVAALPLALLCVASAQYTQNTTPVPILKQINRHNEDGSYSYGYEAADGSFRIETKHPTGEVYGKYGYVDDVGRVREVEYGASRRGFEPTGTDISVPPPTLHQNSAGGVDYEDDGQYREDPRVYYQDQDSNSVSGGVYSGQSRFDNFGSFGGSSRPAAQRPAQRPAPRPAPIPVARADPAPAPRRPVDPSLFRGHPATNFDVNTGSYSVSYSG